VGTELEDNAKALNMMHEYLEEDAREEVDQMLEDGRAELRPASGVGVRRTWELVVHGEVVMTIALGNGPWSL
jgi:hypothetical protein